MASDVMRMRLHLRETRVLAVASDMPSELRVEVESTVRRPRCPAPGFRCTRVCMSTPILEAPNRLTADPLPA